MYNNVIYQKYISSIDLYMTIIGISEIDISIGNFLIIIYQQFLKVF